VFHFKPVYGGSPAVGAWNAGFPAHRTSKRFFLKKEAKTFVT
jgi:hypothetical protein